MLCLCALVEIGSIQKVMNKVLAADTLPIANCVSLGIPPSPYMIVLQRGDRSFREIIIPGKGVRLPTFSILWVLGYFRGRGRDLRGLM